MKFIKCEKFKVTKERILQFQFFASSPVLSYYLCWWKGPDRQSLFSWRLKEALPGHWEGDLTMNRSFLLWAFWETPRWKSKREGTTWNPSCIFFFSFLLRSVYRKQRYQGCCQGKAVQTSCPAKQKDKSANATPFPSQTSSSRFLQQEIGPKFPCRPYRHWQFSHGYKTLCRSKGQHEKIMDYLHERVLKSFSKENETQILFHVPTAEISAAVNWMPALNQLGRKPEGQEGVRWNSGQAGRQEAPRGNTSSSCRSKRMGRGSKTNNNRQSSTSSRCQTVPFWRGMGWHLWRKRIFFLKLLGINYLKRCSFPRIFWNVVILD